MIFLSFAKTPCLLYFASIPKRDTAMKTNLTLKLEKSQQSELSTFAKSLNMTRSKLVRTAITEYVQKQNSQAA